MIREDRVPGTAKQRTGAASRPALAALAVLLAITLSGCISSSASPSAVESEAPSASATATPGPTPTPEPLPSFLTSGYVAPEDAIKAWVEAQGDVYAGDCGSATEEDSGQVCSMASTTEEDTFYLGLVLSEPAWILRLESFGDLWYVAEATYAPAPF